MKLLFFFAFLLLIGATLIPATSFALIDLNLGFDNHLQSKLKEG